MTGKVDEWGYDENDVFVGTDGKGWDVPQNTPVYVSPAQDYNASTQSDGNAGQKQGADFISTLAGVAKEIGVSSQLLTDIGLYTGAGADYAANYSARQGFDDKPTDLNKSDSSWTKMFTDFASKGNNGIELVKIGFGAISGINKLQSEREAAAALSQSRKDELQMKYDLEQKASQANSNAIGSMRPIKPLGKLQPLKRFNGSNVFTPTGLINQGAK